MALTSHLEIERKYDADAGTTVPDLSALPGIERVRPSGTVQMRAVYYDTEDLALARARIALRRREGGADEGWHLKLPAELGRRELHAALTAGEHVPGELRDTVEVVLRGRPLTPLARVETNRTALELIDGRGEVRLELADDRVTGTDLRAGEERSWREWEAELVGDDSEEHGVALLDAAEKLLLDAGARVSGSSSKLAHALGADRLGDGSGAVRAAASAEEAVPQTPGQLVRLRQALEDCDPRVRRDEDDSTHQMRTAARRLRCLLSAGDRASLGRSSGVRDELRRIGAILGEARDLEVQRELVRELAAAAGIRDTREIDALGRETEAEYALARVRITEYLNSTAYFELLDALEDERTAPEPAAADLGHSLRTAGDESLRRAGELRSSVSAVERTAETESSGDAASYAQPRLIYLHRLRRSVRRVRYFAEALAEATGPAGSLTDTGTVPPDGLQRIATAARRAQEVLGEHRDLVLIADRARLATETALRAGRPAVEYEAIAERAAEAAESELAALPEALDQLFAALANRGRL